VLPAEIGRRSRTGGDTHPLTTLHVHDSKPWPVARAVQATRRWETRKSTGTIIAICRSCYAYYDHVTDPIAMHVSGRGGRGNMASFTPGQAEPRL
jgi:hypothetical protein